MMMFANSIFKLASSFTKRIPSGSLLLSLKRGETRSTSGDKASIGDYCGEISKSKLNSLVRNAISQALSHFGGASVAESLLYILELEALHLGLQLMFGNASYVVEEHMRSTLAKSLGLDPEGRSVDQLIDEARRRILDQASIELRA
jgi:hypothetical protein